MSQFRLWAKICVNKMTNMHSNQAQLTGEFMCQKWRSYGISDICSYTLALFHLSENVFFNCSKRVFVVKDI